MGVRDGCIGVSLPSAPAPPRPHGDSLQQRGTDGGKGEIEEEGWEDGERWGKRQRKHEPGVKWYGKVMSKNHQVYCVCAASRLPGARPAVSGQA